MQEKDDELDFLSVVDVRELVVVKEHAACTDLDRENTGQDNHLVVVVVVVDHIVVYRIHDGFLLNDDAADEDEDSRKIE